MSTIYAFVLRMILLIGGFVIALGTVVTSSVAINSSDKTNELKEGVMVQRVFSGIWITLAIVTMLVAGLALFLPAIFPIGLHKWIIIFAVVNGMCGSLTNIDMFARSEAYIRTD